VGTRRKRSELDRDLETLGNDKKISDSNAKEKKEDGDITRKVRLEKDAICTSLRMVLLPGKTGAQGKKMFPSRILN